MILHAFFLIVSASSQPPQSGCEYNCYFNRSEITSKTIVEWPSKCSTVCGNISLTSSLDVPISKLNAAFKNLENLDGVLHMRNTNLTSLSFFPRLTWMDFRLSGFIYSNNSNFEDATFLLGLFKNGYDCVSVVANNPKLDTRGFCELQKKGSARFIVYNNMKNTDCGCNNVIIDKNSIAYYKNCTSIKGVQGLEIVNFYGASLDYLSRLEKVSNLNVHNTDLTDLSALSSLTSIIGPYIDSGLVGLNVYDNPNMTRLKLPTLKRTIPGWGISSMNLYDLHPDFCVTTEEMHYFLVQEVYFNIITAKYCANETRKDGEKLCVFENMSSLESDCIHVQGDVIVDSGDEIHVEKLKTVVYIYGMLIVRDTQLTNFSFFSSLQIIAPLTSIRTMLISRNMKLQNATFPKMTSLFVNREFTARFWYNNPSFLRTQAECAAYEMSLTANIMVNGMDCYGYEFYKSYDEGEKQEFEEETTTLEPVVKTTAVMESESTTFVAATTTISEIETTTEKSGTCITLEFVLFILLFQWLLSNFE